MMACQIQMARHRKVSPLNYTFAVGKIRVLERFLVKQEVFEEAIDLSLNEALGLFVESDLYSDELLHISDSRQLEEVLEKELNNLKILIDRLLLDKRLISFLNLDTIRCAEGILKSYPSRFLTDYLRHLIDMHNIKSFLRLYILKESKERLKEILTCEGFIKREDFLKLYNQEIAAFLNKLEYVHKAQQIVDYATWLGDGIRSATEDGSFILIEKAMSNFLINALRQARYIIFGPEPALAYYFAKRNEINLIRMIILAKLNEIKNEVVRERLTLVYA